MEICVAGVLFRLCRLFVCSVLWKLAFQKEKLSTLPTRCGCLDLCLLIERSKHWTGSSSNLTPSPEHLGGVQHWTRTRTQIAFCPVNCAPQAHLSRTLGGIRPAVNCDAGDRDVFSTRFCKHTGSRKNLPLIAGNHGNWHQSQGTVSRNTCAWNHIRAATAASGGIWRAAQACQRGLWLTGEKQSSYSCQALRMHVYKSKGVFVGKKGAIGTGTAKSFIHTGGNEV